MKFKFLGVWSLVGGIALVSGCSAVPDTHSTGAASDTLASAPLLNDPQCERVNDPGVLKSPRCVAEKAMLIALPRAKQSPLDSNDWSRVSEVCGITFSDWDAYYAETISAPNLSDYDWLSWPVLDTEKAGTLATLWVDPSELNGQAPDVDRRYLLVSSMQSLVLYTGKGPNKTPTTVPCDVQETLND